MVRNLPSEFLRRSSNVIYKNVSEELLTNLKQLCNLIDSKQWLVGESLSVADIAVAAQLSLLRFPLSSGPPLAGKGCPGFSDHPHLQNLFTWRDQIEKLVMRSDS